jgi:HK97 gp10 family phage protein
VKVQVLGLKELDAALGQLSPAAGKGVLRRVGRAALEPMDAAWRRNAPSLYHELEQSGDVGSNLSRSQRKSHDRESTVEVFAGPGTNPQAITQEFGTRFHPAQPFMRPAWDETKFKALDIVKDQLGVEIDKAAQRAARKALKLSKGA